MSKSAIVLLIMTVLSLAMLWLSPGLETTFTLLLKAAGALFGLAFLIALLLGRRIKFDPVLR
ncbi:PA3371 family protein [Pseudomonas sp. SH1-B]